ncbi:hypothetical protein SGRA_0119 [Saprospira grandis str. Lewin]|uniref:Uncharacterized protein n=1 Tax=Saprospira grandis (strain Lewin) TaxID=984262 RepID=H6L4Z2_SAPGL|nr:hypothetical protein SGRA_0119 [Saprospira grandis str. Lewin]
MSFSTAPGPKGPARPSDVQQGRAAADQSPQGCRAEQTCELRNVAPAAGRRPQKKTPYKITCRGSVYLAKAKVIKTIA